MYILVAFQLINAFAIYGLFTDALHWNGVIAFILTFFLWWAPVLNQILATAGNYYGAGMDFGWALAWGFGPSLLCLLWFGYRLYRDAKNDGA